MGRCSILLSLYYYIWHNLSYLLHTKIKYEQKNKKPRELFPGFHHMLFKSLETYQNLTDSSIVFTKKSGSFPSASTNDLMTSKT